ncbi:MAG: S9 family peptidase [Acidobacteriaceae bacterium]|nr:S9 family peptidase [Acidobacteriaceae bacterium]
MRTFRPFAMLAVAAAWAALLISQTSQKKTITLDDLLSQPHFHPIAPNWAPDGKRFTYEEDGAIKLYDTMAKSSREWFRPESLQKDAVSPIQPKDFGWQNRRVSSESYQWFPNSEDLLAEEKGDLFIVRPNGQHEQITKTDIDEEDPKLSPDGKQVLYRWKWNLYVLDLATKQVRQLTTDGAPTLMNGQLDWVYPEELDLGTATWWSPDSKQIAYFQFNVANEFIYPQTDLIVERAKPEPERYPQAGTANALVKLGVVSAQGGSTTWMDLGETSNTLLARVDWSPNSSQLAVQRFNRVQNELDLLFCNPGTGAVRKILHEESKTWLNPADNLYFLKSRPEFLWTSEQSGFRHLYRYSDQGELLGQLTRGDWMVTRVAAIDEANQKVYYTSTEASPLERQLYSVNFGGGTPIRMTQHAGTHYAHANSEGSYFVDTYSSMKQPPETVLLDAAGHQVAVLQPADISQANRYDLLPRQVIPLKTPDGVTLYARLIKPAGFESGKKYPVIVSVYGGPQAQTITDSWAGVTWEQVMAHRGYIVWELDNRGSANRGRAFEAPVYREFGKTEVADQRFGVEQLIKMGFADPARIGITGWSYGGYMTIHAMLRAPDVFKVGVAGAPVTNWHNYDTIYTERYMGLPDQNAPGYDAASNVKNAAKLEGKLLIVHNIEDDNVLFQNTMQMAKALEDANKEFFMQIYPQKTHGVSGPLRRPLYEEMTNFFDAHLKSGT